VHLVGYSYGSRDQADALSFGGIPAFISDIMSFLFWTVLVLGGICLMYFFGGKEKASNDTGAPPSATPEPSGERCEHGVVIPDFCYQCPPDMQERYKLEEKDKQRQESSTAHRRRGTGVSTGAAAAMAGAAGLAAGAAMGYAAGGSRGSGRSYGGSGSYDRHPDRHDTCPHGVHEHSHCYQCEQEERRNEEDRCRHGVPEHEHCRQCEREEREDEDCCRHGVPQDDYCRQCERG